MHHAKSTILIQDGLYYMRTEKNERLKPSGEKVTMGEIRPYRLENIPFDLSEGFIYYRYHHETQSGRIIDLFVTPAYERKGVGRTLVQLSEKALSRMGAHDVGGSSVPSAKGFWQRLGYSIGQYNEIKRRLDF